MFGGGALLQPPSPTHAQAFLFIFVLRPTLNLWVGCADENAEENCRAMCEVNTEAFHCMGGGGGMPLFFRYGTATLPLR